MAAARALFAICPVRRNRQRQDRCLPRCGGANDRGRRPGVAAGAGNQSDAAAGAARARGVARRVASCCCTAAWPMAYGANIGARPQRERRRWCSERASACSRRCRRSRWSSSTKNTTRPISNRTTCAITRATLRCGARIGGVSPSCSAARRRRSNRGCMRRRAGIVRLDLPRRADPRARMPQVRFAGNRSPRAQEGIGEPLRAALAARLARGEQSLVFVNRRGFSPSLLCSACGWEADCPRCSARLTVHRTPAMLRCHHCGHDESAAAGVSGLRQRGPAAARLRHAAAGTRAGGSLSVGAHRANRPRQHARARIVRT